MKGKDSHTGVHGRYAISSARRIRHQPHPANNDTQAPADVLHLAELVSVLRERLEIAAEFSDDAILSSLKAISIRSEERERWRTAFQSNLGLWLSAKQRDLAHDLSVVLSLMPKPRV